MKKSVAGVLLVVYVLLVPARSFRIPRQSHRPSFAGITGGNWANLVGPIIPPGTPWPAKAEDYTTTLTPTIATRVSVPEYQTTSTIDKTSESTSNKDYSKTTTSSTTSLVLEHKPSRPSFAGSTGGNWQTIPTTSLTSTTPSKYEEDSKPPNVLEYQPNRPSFAGITGGNWENLGGQVVPPQNSSLNPEKDTKLSYVHISLNADDIKTAIGNHKASQFLVLAFNLKEDTKTDGKPEDIKKGVEQFFAAEKCNTEMSRTNPLLSILVNVEGLKSLLLDSQIEEKGMQ